MYGRCCLMTLKGRNAAHTRIVQKSKPKKWLLKLEFLGLSDLFCISTVSLVSYRREMIWTVL